MGFFDEVVDAIAKKYDNKGVESRIVYNPQEEFQRISSGSFVIDIFSGGGLALKGGCVEVFGLESSGKTTLAIQTAREVIKAGGSVVYFDAERTFSASYAQMLGLDASSDRLLVLRPRNGEELDETRRMIEKEKIKVDLIVIDSVAAVIPFEMMDTPIGSSQAIGQHAAMWGKLMPRLKLYASMNNCAIFFINQLRAKPVLDKMQKFSIASAGVGFGNSSTDTNVTTPGGFAYRYYLDARYSLSFSSNYKEDDEDIFGDGKDKEATVGNQIWIKSVKSKVNAPYRKAKILLRFGQGVDDIPCLVDIAKSTGAIKQTGAWLEYRTVSGEEVRENGDKRFIAKLRELPEVVKDLVNVLSGGSVATVFGNGVYEEEDADGVIDI